MFMLFSNFPDVSSGPSPLARGARGFSHGCLQLLFSGGIGYNGIIWHKNYENSTAQAFNKTEWQSLGLFRQERILLLDVVGKEVGHGIGGQACDV